MDTYKINDSSSIENIQYGVSDITTKFTELEYRFEEFETRTEVYLYNQDIKIDKSLKDVDIAINTQLTAIDNKMHLNEIYMKTYMEEYVKTQTNIIENKLKRDTKIIIGLIVLNIIGIITGIIL